MRPSAELPYPPRSAAAKSLPVIDRHDCREPAAPPAPGQGPLRVVARGGGGGGGGGAACQQKRFGCLYLFVVARVLAKDVLHELVVLLCEVEERLRVVLVRVLVLRRRVAAGRRARRVQAPREGRRRGKGPRLLKRRVVGEEWRG